MHRLHIDWIKCDGYGLCGDYAPDVIELDEWRYPIVDGGPIDQALLDEVQRAVDCCPMKALTLVETSPETDPRGRPGQRGRQSRRASSRAS